MNAPLLTLLICSQVTVALIHPAAASSPSDLIRAGEQFVDRLGTGRFAEAAESFEPVMAKAMPVEKLQSAWESVQQQFGAFQGQLTNRTGRVQGFDVVWVTCRFEKSFVDVMVVFDPDARVSGLWFTPAKAPSPDQSPAKEDRAEFSTTEVEVVTGDWRLPGTLCVPAGPGPFPGVVLVHGSGPHDRDETIGPNRPFRDLSEGLARRGIAVLRYEKRTKAHPLRMAARTATLTVQEEAVEDARSAVALLRRTERLRASGVFVLGHSLGGMLIPRIGAGDAGVAGFIVMAGGARPLEDLYLEQMTYLLTLEREPTEAARAQLRSAERQVARVKDPQLSTNTPAMELPMSVPPSYWLDLRGYQPAEAMQQLPQPILILQGGRDYQVTETDFGLWKAALAGRSNAQFRFYPDLNHLFMPGVGKATPGEYLEAGHVAAQVIEDIAVWIHAVLNSPPERAATRTTPPATTN